MMKVHVETFHASLHKKNEELCGDKVKIARNEESCICVLADGLGSGVKANILATLTSEILSTMIAEKMDIEDAVETISATLPICQERKIAYSTFIVLQVFYDGRVYLEEYDSPNVIWMRDGKVMKIDRKERIIHGKKVRESKFIAQPQDQLILFSDGILHAGTGTVLNLGWDQKDIEKHMETMWKQSDNARDSVHHLLYAVRDLYQGECGDDSTVACVKLLEPKETRVMIGPCADKNDDQRAVDQLMSASGYKIVCGGTTSQIVSRVLKKELNMGQPNLRGDVPPIAFIEGVDLVCEGALTIHKCIDYLNACIKDQNYLETFLDSSHDDGAQMLCEKLLTSSSIHFLVGTADNPAHNGLLYSPISLSQKMKHVETMQELLKQLGKMITFTYY